MNSNKRNQKKMAISALSSFVLYATLSFVATNVADETVSNILFLIAKFFLLAFIVLGFTYYVYGAKDKSKKNIADEKNTVRSKTTVSVTEHDKSDKTPVNYKELFVYKYLDSSFYAAVVADSEKGKFYTAVYKSITIGGATGYKLDSIGSEITRKYVEELADKSEDSRAKKYRSSKYFCVRCNKYLEENEIISENDKSFCSDCIRAKEILENQLARIDEIVNRVISESNSEISDSMALAIKNDAKGFIKNYSDNSQHRCIFYWSEYPMGATHSKEFCKIKSVWCVYQYDYDKKPSGRKTEYPNLNDDNLLEGFVEVLLTENHYN